MNYVYVVQCINDPELYWNNEAGWTEKKQATRFSIEERFNFHLPIEGKWKKLDNLK